MTEALEGDEDDTLLPTKGAKPTPKFGFRGPSEISLRGEEILRQETGKLLKIDEDLTLDEMVSKQRSFLTSRIDLELLRREILEDYDRKERDSSRQNSVNQLDQSPPIKTSGSGRLASESLQPAEKKTLLDKLKETDSFKRKGGALTPILEESPQPGKKAAKSKKRKESEEVQERGKLKKRGSLIIDNDKEETKPEEEKKRLKYHITNALRKVKEEGPIKSDKPINKSETKKQEATNSGSRRSSKVLEENPIINGSQTDRLSHGKTDGGLAYKASHFKTANNQPNQEAKKGGESVAIPPVKSEEVPKVQSPDNPALKSQENSSNKVSESSNEEEEGEMEEVDEDEEEDSASVSSDQSHPKKKKKKKSKKRKEGIDGEASRIPQSKSVVRLEKVVGNDINRRQSTTNLGTSTKRSLSTKLDAYSKRSSLWMPGNNPSSMEVLRNEGMNLKLQGLTKNIPEENEERDSKAVSEQPEESPISLPKLTTPGKDAQDNNGQGFLSNMGTMLLTTSKTKSLREAVKKLREEEFMRMRKEKWEKSFQIINNSKNLSPAKKSLKLTESVPCLFTQSLYPVQSLPQIKTPRSKKDAFIGPALAKREQSKESGRKSNTTRSPKPEYPLTERKSVEQPVAEGGIRLDLGGGSLTLLDIIMRHSKKIQSKNSYEIGEMLLMRIVQHKIDDIILDFLVFRGFLLKEDLANAKKDFLLRTKIIRLFRQAFRVLRPIIFQNPALSLQFIASSHSGQEYLNKHIGNRKLSLTIENQLDLPANLHVNSTKNISSPKFLALPQVTRAHFGDSNFLLGELSTRKLNGNSESEYLSYYFLRIGEPSKIICLDQVVFKRRPGLRPEHVIKIAQRFHFNTKQESDLVWIFYLLVTIPPPPSSLYGKFYVEMNVNEFIESIATSLLGSFAGDQYFQLLLDHNRFRRNDELVKLSNEARKEYLGEVSWLRFKENSKPSYLYNFFTGETQNPAPWPQKRNETQGSDDEV